METPTSIANDRRGMTPVAIPRHRSAILNHLYAYRRTHGIATWEQSIEQLFPAMEAAEVTR